MTIVRCPVKSCIYNASNGKTDGTCLMDDVYFSQDYGSEDSENMSCDCFKEGGTDNEL